MMFISFIVPVYNVERYLNRCLGSILACSLANSEIILVTGRSSDTSNEICEQYCRRYPNVHMLAQDATGLSDARNCGFKIAKGEYTVFVDSDDFLDSSLFDKALAAVRENPKAEVFVFDFKRVDPNQRVTWQSNQIDKTEAPISGYDYLGTFLSRPGGFWNVWRYIYKTEFLRENNLWFRKDFLSEDVDYTIDVLLYAKEFRFFHNPYYCYLTGRGDSLMDVVTFKRMRDTAIILTDNIEKVLKNASFLHSTVIARKLAFELILTMVNIYSIAPEERGQVIQLYQSRIALVKIPGFLFGQLTYYVVKVVGVRPVAYGLHQLRQAKRFLKKVRG